MYNDGYNPPPPPPHQPLFTYPDFYVYFSVYLQLIRSGNGQISYFNICKRTVITFFILDGGKIFEIHTNIANGDMEPFIYFMQGTETNL
jgi:hypothetical protein